MAPQFLPEQSVRYQYSKINPGLKQHAGVRGTSRAKKSPAELFVTSYPLSPRLPTRLTIFVQTSESGQGETVFSIRPRKGAADAGETLKFRQTT